MMMGTDTANQPITAEQWAYSPRMRTRSSTKGALRMDMTGGSRNSHLTFQAMREKRAQAE
jgi:hypothetical protein